MPNEYPETTDTRVMRSLNASTVEHRKKKKKKKAGASPTVHDTFSKR
jgi:hypothetical protein